MDKLSDENSSHELVEFSSWSCHREAHINMEPESMQFFGICNNFSEFQNIIEFSIGCGI